MSVLSGIGSPADLVAHEPPVAAARAAVCAASELIPWIARSSSDVAADLVASLAVMECLAAEAMFERGRMRKRLLQIARAKAARAHGAIDAAEAWGGCPDDLVASAQSMLELAIDALLPPEHPPLSALLRR